MKRTILFDSFLLIFFSISLLFSNEIEKIIDEVLEGENKYSFIDIDQKLMNLNSKHANTLILKGLIENNGKKSFDYFNEYVKTNKNGKYSELATSKICDYYYSQGLYIKASEWYRKFIFSYPNSNKINYSINYYLNSLSVSGNLDSAKYYAKLLKEKYPDLSFNSKFYVNNKKNEKKKTNLSKKYSVEIGVYEQYRTASYYKGILSSEGFLSRIDEIIVGSKTLYALRVGYYKDFSKVENLKKRIYSRLGLPNLSIVQSN